MEIEFLCCIIYVRFSNRQRIIVHILLAVVSEESHYLVILHIAVYA